MSDHSRTSDTPSLQDQTGSSSTPFSSSVTNVGTAVPSRTASLNAKPDYDKADWTFAQQLKVGGRLKNILLIFRMTSVRS